METFEPVDEIITQGKQKEPRPSFLTTLCVLSYIFIGISLLVGLNGLFQGPLSQEEMLQQKVEMTKTVDEMKSMEMDDFSRMMEQLQRMYVAINEHFYTYSMISLVVMGLGLYGVITMWKGRKTGFHFYIIYCILSIVQLYFVVSPADIPSMVVVWNLIISTIFVLLYARNLKWME